MQKALARLQAMRDIPECLRDTFGGGGYERQLQALEAELNAARSAARGSKSLKEQLDGKQAFTKRMEKKAAAADAAGRALQEQLVALNAEAESHRKTVAEAHAEWDTAKAELAVLSARYRAELTLGAASGAAPDGTPNVTLGANVTNILQALCKIVAPGQILQACGGDQQIADSLPTQTAELLADAARQMPPPCRLLPPTKSCSGSLKSASRPSENLRSWPLTQTMSPWPRLLPAPKQLMPKQFAGKCVQERDVKRVQASGRSLPSFRSGCHLGATGPTIAELEGEAEMPLCGSKPPQAECHLVSVAIPQATPSPNPAGGKQQGGTPLVEPTVAHQVSVAVPQAPPWPNPAGGKQQQLRLTLKRLEGEAEKPFCGSKLPPTAPGRNLFKVNRGLLTTLLMLCIWVGILCDEARGTRVGQASHPGPRASCLNNPPRDSMSMKI